MKESGFIGTGWAFPPSFSAAANYTVDLNSGEENIKQSIDLILQTPRGSRSLLPMYGSNLSNYLFRQINASLEADVIHSVETALLYNEPRIRVEAITTTVSEDASSIFVNILFIIKSTNSRSNHVYPFCVLEGTHLRPCAQ